MPEALLTYEARPWTVNAERSGGGRGIVAYNEKGNEVRGRRARALLTEEWRATFFYLAQQRGLPKGLDAVRITALQETRDRRMPDIGACYPAVKAAIDGLVDYQLIPDDDGGHLVLLGFEPPRTTGRDALSLHIEWDDD